jgi:predicted tellurium resistance membrane protein TerC
MDLDFLTHAPFWVALGQIIIIDILLGGDNAVVIALASASCRPSNARRASSGAQRAPSSCASS